MSLVRVLKNTYRDIESISIKNPHYNEKPGDWSCYVEIRFADEQNIGYHLGHSLRLEINGAAVAQPNIIDLLEKYYGTTENEVKVIFSNEDKGER